MFETDTISSFNLTQHTEVTITESSEDDYQYEEVI